MPIQKCTSGGKPGYQYGESGHCYTYTPGNEESRKKAKQKSIKQGLAIDPKKFAEEASQEEIGLLDMADRIVVMGYLK